MSRYIAGWLLLTLLPAALGRPGMLTWVCKSCANANMVFNAEAEMRTGDGSVIGQLRLLQSIPRDQADNTVKGPVMIDVGLKYSQNLFNSYLFRLLTAG